MPIFIYHFLQQKYLSPNRVNLSKRKHENFSSAAVPRIFTLANVYKTYKSNENYSNRRIYYNFDTSHRIFISLSKSSWQTHFLVIFQLKVTFYFSFKKQHQQYFTAFHTL